MKKIWTRHLFLLLVNIICLQTTLMYAAKDADVKIGQTCDQNNDAEENETRHSLDDEIIAETIVLPYLLPPSKPCFYLAPGQPLPSIIISLHCPPPNAV